MPRERRYLKRNNLPLPQDTRKPTRQEGKSWGQAVHSNTTHNVLETISEAHILFSCLVLSSAQGLRFHIIAATKQMLAQMLICSSRNAELS